MLVQFDTQVWVRLEAVLPLTWQELTQTLFSPYFPDGHIALHKLLSAYPVMQVPKHVVVVFYPKVDPVHAEAQMPVEESA